MFDEMEKYNAKINNRMSEAEEKIAILKRMSGIQSDDFR